MIPNSITLDEHTHGSDHTKLCKGVHGMVVAGLEAYGWGSKFGVVGWSWAWGLQGGGEGARMGVGVSSPRDCGDLGVAGLGYMWWGL